MRLREYVKSMRGSNWMSVYFEIETGWKESPLHLYENGYTTDPIPEHLMKMNIKRVKVKPNLFNGNDVEVVLVSKFS